jgi:hypothetical protein
MIGPPYFDGFFGSSALGGLALIRPDNSGVI